MFSLVLHDEKLKNFTRSSFGDICGLLLESDDANVFIPYSIVDRIVDYQKRAMIFISQSESEQKLSSLLSLLYGSSVITTSDKTFLVRCKADKEVNEDFSSHQKKSIQILYEKYVGEEKSKNKEENDIPF